jgi:predicted AlkP superfamily phosphohydrolase/phosphomutase
MKHSTQTCLLLCVAVLGALQIGCVKAQSEQVNKKLIVLGIDGMDPKFLEDHWDVLPNLNQLRHTGGFERLETTIPPQSPVAWSTVITGMEPQGHGIFDFIHRDPVKMQPYSSMSATEAPDNTLSIGPWILPLSEGRVKTFRRGQAFWQLLAAQHVPSVILRMPTNFPPVECEGEALSGMGTPDLLGTFGTFTYFTSDPKEKIHDVPGGRIVPVTVANHKVVLKLEGPPNSLRKDQAITSVTMTAYVDPAQPVARFEVGDQQFVLKEGEWSRWVTADFPMVRGVAYAHGMLRVFAKRLGQDFRVYVSPINLNPTQQDLPITQPVSYGRQLAKAVGPFYTQGMAEDTAALRQGVLDRHEYLEQSRLVANEHLAILHQAVKDLKSGFLFFHFFGIDQNSHMLFGTYDDELLETYRRVDQEIGWVRQTAPDATLLVMSDHGFSTFDRAVHLNSLLRKEGLLTLIDDSKPGGESFENIDWSRTQAYAVGLSGIYVNQFGRERDGIVQAGPDTDAVLQKIISKLKDLRDPASGKAVVDSVYTNFQAGNSHNGPDLIVGFNPSFRASWQTALGATPLAVIENNDEAWLADHIIAPKFVPGVLLSNRKLKAEHPRLVDIPATVLQEFNVPLGSGMTGKSVF